MFIPKVSRNGESCFTSTDGTIGVAVVVDVERNLLPAAVVLEGDGSLDDI